MKAWLVYIDSPDGYWCAKVFGDDNYCASFRALRQARSEGFDTDKGTVKPYRYPQGDSDD